MSEFPSERPDRGGNSVNSLRRMVTVTLVVAAVSGMVWLWLIANVSQNTTRMGELSRIATSATALYAEGLQMCQATRNILLDPANEKAWTNHAAASKSFGQVRDELERDLGKWSSEASARTGAVSVKADFAQHLTIQQRIHLLAKQGDFDSAKRVLNSEDTPLWRKYKDEILALRAKVTKEAGAVKAEVAGQCVWANRLA